MKNRKISNIFLVAALCWAATCCYSQQVTFLDFTEDSGVAHVYGNDFNELGGGASFCDINGDGFDDLAITSAIGHPMQFYLSDGVSFSPIDILPASYADTFETKNVFFIDYDNDGDQDLFITSYLSGTKLFQNNDLVFTDVTIESGIEPAKWKTFVSAWADFDRDGHLDLLIANRHFPDQSLERNFLYKNNGDGTFQEVAEAAGIDNPGLGNMPLAASFVDYNNDGWPDIFLAIDKFFGNILYKNNGDGTFEDVSLISNFFKEMDGMCVAPGDYDNDGDIDIYVTNAPQVQYGNELYRNNGNGTFTWSAQQAGVKVHKHGWGANFFDYDNDGWLDLFVVNSSSADSSGAFDLNWRNPLYKNLGNGTFEEMFGVGTDEDTLSASYGTAIGDFNDDGFYDIVVVNNYDPTPGHFNNSKIYRSNGGSNNWIKIQLEGVESNRNGIGSRIMVKTGNDRQYRYTTCGQSYASQNSLNEIIGIGSHQAIDSLTITWPSGLVDVLTDVEPNQRLIIVEGSTIVPPPVVQTGGIFQNDSLSFNGYTLFAPMNSTETYLIDNCGAVVNTWTSTYLPGASCYLLEDGSLLRAGRVTGTPMAAEGVGGKIERFDWDGNLTWSYGYVTSNYQLHHDLELLPNGNILLLAWDKVTETNAIAAGRDPELVTGKMWTEKILEIQPSGTNGATIVWEWKLWDHLVQDFDDTKPNHGTVAEHPELVDLNFAANADEPNWVNANSIDYHPGLDQILLSAGHFGEIWIIDHSTSTAGAAGHTGGNAGKGGDLLVRWGNPQAYQSGTPNEQVFFSQHDAQWVADSLADGGKIMVFNNGKGRTGGISYSSVDVLSLPVQVDGNYAVLPNGTFGPTALDWSYMADPLTSFYTPSLSGAQRLPNGNLLICAGTTGHFFEIDTLGNQVWDFVAPIANNGQPLVQGIPTNGNQVFRATRYTADFAAFEGKDLSPGLPIELEPWDLPCEIVEEEEEVVIDPPSASMETEIQLAVRIMQNPAGEMLQVENLTGKEISAEVMDITGRRVLSYRSSHKMVLENVQHLAKGLYILNVSVENGAAVFSQKFVKN